LLSNQQLISKPRSGQDVEWHEAIQTLNFTPSGSVPLDTLLTTQQYSVRNVLLTSTYEPRNPLSEDS